MPWLHCELYGKFVMAVSRVNYSSWTKTLGCGVEREGIQLEKPSWPSRRELLSPLKGLKAVLKRIIELRISQNLPD